jgi:hypothetical protein
MVGSRHDSAEFLDRQDTPMAFDPDPQPETIECDKCGREFVQSMAELLECGEFRLCTGSICGEDLSDRQRVHTCSKVPQALSSSRYSLFSKVTVFVDNL